MQIKPDFVLKTIAGNHIVVPVGTQNLNFRGMVSLNAPGAFLWEKMTAADCTQEALVAALLAEYEVDKATAEADVAAFITKLKEADLLA